MARIDNYTTQGIHGAVGKKLVYKTLRNGKTFVSPFPDRSKVKYTKKQTSQRKRFAAAVKFALDTMKDPAGLGDYKLKRGETLYQAAIKAFLKETKPGPVNNLSRIYTDKYLSELPLNIRQFRALKRFRKKGIISNASYRALNKISKPTATRDLQDLVKKKILIPNGIHGAGAFYELKGSAKS